MPDQPNDGVRVLHAAIPRMMLELARLATATEKLADSIEFLIRSAHVPDAWLSAHPEDQDNQPTAPSPEPSSDDADGAR